MKFLCVIASLMLIFSVVTATVQNRSEFLSQFRFSSENKSDGNKVLKLDGDGDSILRLNQWYHIAAVSGKDGMKLYLNGVLVGEHDYTGSFSAINNGEYNYFGKSHWSENDFFKGELDEIRLWKVARTGEQIRDSMYQKLSGDEKDLVGLWNFDSGDAQDLSSGYDGTLFGDARCVETELPSPNNLVRPAVLEGVIIDETGKKLAIADIRLEQDEKIIARTTTSDTGEYRMVIYPTHEPYDLLAMWNEKGDWQLGVQFSQGEHRTINLRLKRTVSISGTLFAWDKTLHTGISVQAVRLNESTGRRKVVATTLSDESGNYHFINLKPGNYLVRCYTLGGYVYYGMEGWKGGKGRVMLMVFYGSGLPKTVCFDMMES